MKRLMMTALAAAALTVSACNREAAAADPIAGTWKADLASAQYEEKPSTYLLKDGTYSCSTCVPPLETKADGQFHPVADRPYYDSISVTEVDERTVKIVRRKGDKMTSETTLTVSPDGQTLNFAFTEAMVEGGKTVEGEGTDTRVAPAPAGAHAISGSWKPGKLASISEEALTVSYRTEGNTIHMNSGAGESYSATAGGPEVPIKGDTGGTTVAVERPSPNVLKETFRRKGEVVSVTTVTVGENGTMTGVSENKRTGAITRWTAAKQS